MSNTTQTLLSNGDYPPVLELRRANPQDFSDLSHEAMLRLHFAIREFHSASRRMVSELYVITSQINIMSDILGHRLQKFAKDELGIESRTLRRYMHIYNVLQAHFMTGGRVDLNEINQFNQSALALLSPTTEPQVIERLRDIAQSGTTVTEKLVRAVLAEVDSDTTAELASTQAELSKVSKQLEEERASREVERAKAHRESASQAEVIRRTEQRAKDLAEEIDILQKRETVVTVQQVQILPEGYATLDAAVTAKTLEKQELERQAEEARRKIQNLSAEAHRLETEIASREVPIEKFLEMKKQAEALINQFPTALLRSLSEADPNIKQAIEHLGNTMIIFGRQLTGSVS